MARCIRSAVLLLATPILLVAQQANEMFLSKKHLNDIVRSVRKAAAVTGFTTAHPDQQLWLEHHLETIEAAANELELTFLKASHWKDAGIDHKKWETDLNLAIDSVQMMYGFLAAGNIDSITGLSQLLAEESISKELFDSIDGPMEELQTRQLGIALKDKLERLRKFEIKFGPESAKLNLVEVGLNYWILGGLDWFGIDDGDTPGPLEMIAAYNTAYLTRDAGSPLVSGAEVGVRIYVFAKGWGEGNPLKPAYLSLGALVSGEEDGVLQFPGEGGTRIGAFAAWGSVKAAWLFIGDNNRLLLTKQFQLIPFLF